MLEWNDELKMKRMLEKLFESRENLLLSIFHRKKPIALYSQEMIRYEMGYLSSGETALVELALHFWFNDGTIDLNSLLYLLDDHSYQRFVDVLAIMRK